MAERERAGRRGAWGVSRRSSLAPRRPAGGERDEGLHVCPACAGRLVHPIDWAPERGKRWRVLLRCPDCDWVGGGSFSQRAVDALDERLDAGAAELLEDLTTLARANLEEQAERFIAALRADRILPEDF